MADAPKNPVAAQRQAERTASETAAAQRQAQRDGRARAEKREKAKAAAAAAMASIGRGKKEREATPAATAREEGAARSARERWGHVRHCEAMRRALASAQWATVLWAVRENEAQLAAAREALAVAKAQVATLDEDEVQPTREPPSVEQKLREQQDAPELV